ncbi:hypothetical protein [Niabella drilacis]|uniref:HEAT repeat-containing protein n=1 Tax=Niabella drilacis (strain DSM 25811 / CCM 8410 / CCUG 62505 / LMG 26954 / E90) TaxID=1285928 RepID=A0A1G6KJE1_NIADE|nr:hypothetical protein [Niabella drilacis]SDC31232.1 hypothetical protein SAMN04487894_1024 [Niabella drilacis]
MSIIAQLSTSLGRRDEVPNQELAAQIAKTNNKKAVGELVENLSNKNKDIQHDCIKTLYETGSLKPALILPYFDDFIRLLGSKNNRLQWGAMAALDQVAMEDTGATFRSIPVLAAAADSGSVITRDHFVSILIKLCGVKAHAADAFALLNEQLRNCPANQLPMYAENALPVINESNKAAFTQALTARLNDFEKESKRKRVEKVLKKMK